MIQLKVAKDQLKIQRFKSFKLKHGEGCIWNKLRDNLKKYGTGLKDDWKDLEWA